jgi:sterol 3beta-glucosyltransferase
VALAQAFMRAGHDVRLGGWRHEPHRALADSVGVAYAPLGSGREAQIMAEEMRRGGYAQDAVRLLGVLIGEMHLPFLEQMYEDCLPLAEWADVVIAHTAQAGGRMAAEQLNRPLVVGAVDPSQVATAGRPPEGLPDLGAGMNLLLWRAVELGLRGWVDGVNSVRARVGLPRLAGDANSFFFAPRLNLLAASPRLIPKPAAWGERFQLTGYWFLDQPASEPPPEFREFIDQGPRPIAISFGSVYGEDMETLRLVLAAVRRANVRAIIDSAAGSDAVDASPDVYMNAAIPHSRLFGSVAAVIHHGGAGTTGAVLRAGVPGIVIPWALDQFYWAKLAHRLGAAPRPLPRRRLTVDRLVGAIRLVHDDRRLRARAERVGAAVASEEGTRTAVRLVEEFLAG